MPYSIVHCQYKIQQNAVKLNNKKRSRSARLPLQDLRNLAPEFDLCLIV